MGLSIKQQLVDLLTINEKIHLSRLKRKEVKEFLSNIELLNFNSPAEKAYAILNDISNRPLCLSCGSLTRFNRHNEGFFRFCSISCSSKFLSKRGKDHHFSSDIIKKKIENTNLKKYGVTSPLKLQHIHNKGVKASLEKEYNRGLNFLSAEFIEKRNNKITSGIYHTQLEEIKNKIKSSNKNTYISKYLPQKLQELNSNGYYLVDNASEFTRFVDNTWKHQCGEIFKAFPNCRFDVFCPKCKKAGISLPHQILIEKIKELNIHFVVNDRRQIAPKELDIYFPDKNVAVEVNGVYFHNDNVLSNKNYHVEKTNLATQKGIRLLHFWDFEIISKMDLVLDIIKSALGLCEKIAARKCKVEKISKIEAIEFCEKYHLNGSVNFSFSVGLYYNNQLLGCMLLGKSRFGINRDSLEIIRMCFKSNYQIQGGISKMVSYVKATVKTDIISYQDGRLGFGKSYANSGFKLIKRLSPNYIYIKGQVIISRQKAMKYKLKKLLGNSFDPVLTEKENMSNNGWLICYDAGHLLWKI